MREKAKLKTGRNLFIFKVERSGSWFWRDADPKLSFAGNAMIFSIFLLGIDADPG
jgi:hypothetical protein